MSNVINQNEIFVIADSGLPIYYYNNLSDEEVSKDHILQSGFFTAINQFANELKLDELKYVIFEKRNYVLGKTKDLLLVFSEKPGSSNNASPENLEKIVLKSAKFFENSISEKNKDGYASQLNQTQLKEIVTEFNTWLIGKEVIKTEKKNFDMLKMQGKFRKVIFKTVGYSPGKCNIGHQERQKRLIIGLISAIIGLVGFIFLNFLETNINLSKEFRLLLFFPFLGFFMGLYQFFFKFCIANGITKKFVMK